MDDVFNYSKFFFQLLLLMLLYEYQGRFCKQMQERTACTSEQLNQREFKAENCITA